MTHDEIVKEIKEHWFKDHVAAVTQQGDLQVLVWKRPNSGTYNCRYVFDGSQMYISGDIGQAVFRLTWKADVHSFRIGIHYFYEKLSAYSDDKMEFDSDKAVKRLREWLKDLKEDGRKYDHDEMKSVFDLARECDKREQWGWRLQDHTDFISEIDPDYWEQYNQF